MVIEKNSKNVIWNRIGASLTAFTSLFFAIIVTRINGTNDAGIFMYSFATACILYIIGVYLGRTFQVTDISGKYSDTDYIYNRILTCVIMIIIAIIFCLLRGYDTYKTAIFVLINIFKSIDAFNESMYSIIQRHENLHKVRKINGTKGSIGNFSVFNNRYNNKKFVISMF